MANDIIPSIGSSGIFVLKTPLNTLISSSEKYTCLALRKISEYLANNEEVLDIAYIKNGLTESNYNVDYKNDVIIVSLQSDTGHWLYIPVSYIESYPITNGVPYRAVMIGVSLPSIPVTKSLSNIETSIVNLITDNLGVTAIVKTVETSRVILVPKITHDATELARNIIINNNTTDAAKYNKVLQDLQAALDKITSLEQYIIDNHI